MSPITIAFIFIVALACFTSLIFAWVALVNVQYMQSRNLIKEPLQDPDHIGQLCVGPEDQGHNSKAFDFVARGGRLAYMHIFLLDPFDVDASELVEARPTELTDSFITIS